MVQHVGCELAQLPPLQSVNNQQVSRLLAFLLQPNG